MSWGCGGQSQWELHQNGLAKVSFNSSENHSPPSQRLALLDSGTLYLTFPYVVHNMQHLFIISRVAPLVKLPNMHRQQGPNQQGAFLWARSSDMHFCVMYTHFHTQHHPSLSPTLTHVFLWNVHTFPLTTPITFSYTHTCASVECTHISTHNTTHHFLLHSHMCFCGMYTHSHTQHPSLSPTLTIDTG